MLRVRLVLLCREGDARKRIEQVVLVLLVVVRGTLSMKAGGKRVEQGKFTL